MQWAERDRWVYDTIFFEATIRKSGNSLVITIPPELARRFLLFEGQKVRLIGAVKRGLQAEGAISVHLGRFVVKENAQGIEFRLSGPNVEEKASSFVETVATKYSATKMSVKPRRQDEVLCRLTFGCITGEGMVLRTGREIRAVMEEISNTAARSGFTISDLRMFEEEILWQNVDPALISRFLPSLEGKVKFEWLVL